MRAIVAASLLGLAAAVLVPAYAQPLPTIVEIVFEDNQVTQPRVMQRELVIAVGDPADPGAIARSRQALLDLGLFRRVYVREEPVEGGVRVVFQVDERYYLLPSPRLDAKSDGRYAYGVQFRWNNVAGLNHTLRVFVEEEERRRQGIGKETNYVAAYSAPFVFDSPYAVSVGPTRLMAPPMWKITASVVGDARPARRARHRRGLAHRRYGL